MCIGFAGGAPPQGLRPVRTPKRIQLKLGLRAGGWQPLLGERSDPRRPPPRPAARPCSFVQMGVSADSPPTSWKGPITPEEHKYHADFVATGLPVELPCDAPSYLVQKGALRTVGAARQRPPSHSFHRH